MSNKVFYVNNAGTSVYKVLTDLTDETPIDDPTEWLASGDIPKVHIKRINTDEGSITNVKKVIVKSLTNTLSVDVVNSYLYYIGDKLLTGNLDKKWRLKTGLELPRGRVSLSSILGKVDTGMLTISDSDIDSSAPALDDIDVAAQLLANYRIHSLNKNSTESHKAIIKARLDTNLINNNIITENIKDHVYEHSAWIIDPDYRKICAAYDMFLKKFPEHQYSILRMCVQGARLKDCSLLSDIIFAKKLLGVDESAFLNYAVDGSVSHELVNYLNYLEDDTPLNGYFFYLKELGIIGKSPFSTTQNPNTHNWIHMMGALLGEDRSINSRIVSGQKTQVMNLAISCAYLARNKADISPRFAKDQATLNKYRELAEADGESAITPEKVIGAIREFSTDSGEADVMREWARSKVHNFVELREGSIGSFLKSQLSVIN
ncbi:nucleoprotein [Almendravirus balsa]|uniref:nucleoprotein n=1 Tax=Almendravirus balsa TaxID=1972684 RepID=UPI001E281B0B|nr:nucleoprotein [Almendravirus balsa]